MKKNGAKGFRIVLICFFIFFFSSWGVALPKYTITHLTLGGTWSTAVAINELGQVVGTSHITGDVCHRGFIYDRGKMIDIGELYPYDINNLGQVVGYYDTEINGNSTVRSFIYHRGTFVDLGTISSDPRAQSWANSINDYGQVVGSANTIYVGSNFHAYLYSNGVMEDIDRIGPDQGQSEALVINNHGIVLGNEKDAGIFLYSSGVMWRLNIFGDALDMNDQGEFVGWGSWGPGLQGAFLYSKGEITVLGGLSDSKNTKPLAINEKSQIVGQSDIGYVKRPWGYRRVDHAFLFDQGVMTDLNTLIDANLGWELMYATDINARGQIVGYGVRDGKFQTVCYNDDIDDSVLCYHFPIYSAFLLTPIIEVTIDIKPGETTNGVHLRNNGRIPVAILSTIDFDAPRQIDQGSLTFGLTGNEKSKAFCNQRPKDVNGDGLKDLVCYFDIRSTGLSCNDLVGILKGVTKDGMPIEGKDSVTIMRCP
ncbi:MAG: DUF3466 family protein [Syntrophaceae bacterium]|nr:DUF3466 family protein [Syntrophaceae bacterium]